MVFEFFRHKKKNTQTPPQPAASLTTGGVGTSGGHLQQVNEELYKRNLELAIKNQTLSLLGRLYEVGSDTFDIDPLIEGLGTSITEILSLPFVGFLLTEKESGLLAPRGVYSFLDQGKNFLPPHTDEKNTHRTTLPKTHVCMEVLTSRKVKEVSAFEDVVNVWVDPTLISTIQEKKPVKTALLFPILSGDSCFGVLVLGLDRAFADLSIFEQSSIQNLVDVVSISIDKAIAYEYLKRANLRLQELDRQKTEFLSIASHQLRTPLSIIKGYLELIGDGAYGKITKKTKKILTDMDEANERLVKLVDDFLDITRIEQGRTKFSFSSQQLSDTVSSVVSELQKRAEDKGLTLEWKVPTDEIPVDIDEEKIRHVVFNYIDNAIKYSTEGTIRAQMKTEEQGITFTVVDQGLGFEKEDEANFFQKFYRGKNVEGTNVNGTGLGIYVCKKFITAHGGQVWATSPGKGKGSEFGFWIPSKHDSEAGISDENTSE